MIMHKSNNCVKTANTVRRYGPNAVKLFPLLPAYPAAAPDLAHRI